MFLFKEEEINKTNFIAIFLYYCLVAFFVFYFKLNYLITLSLYFTIPSLYFFIKKPNIIKKTVLFSFLVSVPMELVFDYMGHISEAWYTPSVVGFRLLNQIPIDEFIWVFFYVLFIISFYEYFFDRDRNKKKFSSRIKYLAYILLSFLFIFSLIYLINNELLRIKYYYIFFVIFVFITPAFFIIYKYPRIFEKIVLQSLFFLVLGIIYELSAIYAGNWYFRGEYIGWVELFSFRFPFEEFLWLLLATSAVLSVYEFFADDIK